MKKFDVIAIGELNVDLILNNIDGEPEIGKEKFAKNMTLALGSSTAIFAANIASLGTKTGFVGMIGKDSFGRLIKNELAAKNVDTGLLIETDKYATGATIVLSYDEDRANFTYQGAMDFMSFEDIDKSVFGNTRHIHISSVFMQSGIMKDLTEILSYARSKGVTTSLDTQWDPTEKWDFDYREILPLVNVFLPNEKELVLLTHSSNLNEAIEKIRPYINVCVVKRGNQGSLMITNKGDEFNKAAFLNEHVVDTIGAGDSFNAGFINGFIKGEPLEKCQIQGNLMGAINTTGSGGTGAFSSKIEIEKMAKDILKQDISL